MGDTKRGRERKGAGKEAQTEQFLIERAIERHQSDRFAPEAEFLPEFEDLDD